MKKRGTDQRLAEFKRDVVELLGAECSAVLLDPETGVEPCITSGRVLGRTGLIVAADTGSTGEVGMYRTEFVADWSVESSLRVGAAGVKMLLYYHPEAAHAAARRECVTTLAAECHRWGLPLFLEPLSISVDGTTSPVRASERREVVIQSARELVPLGADVLKAEFPLDVTHDTDPTEWSIACRELSDACRVPWVLLSAGVPFELFEQQARVACAAGASGVMAGRALWNEALTTDREKRRTFLSGKGRDRMRRLRNLCDSMARPLVPITDGAT